MGIREATVDFDTRAQSGEERRIRFLKEEVGIQKICRARALISVTINNVICNAKPTMTMDPCLDAQRSLC